MQYIQFQGQNASQVPTPVAGGSNLFIDLSDFNIKAKDENGQIHGGGDITSLTYTGFVNTIATSGLSAGSFYTISDFRTCYDQPDFNSVGNSITTGNYKQSAVQPIIIFATSVSTISVDAYQPTYPNDKIKYDWTYSATEVTNGVAYGRITERIDEFDNRTDYDHREVLFKRYDSYYYEEKNITKGTIELIENTGEVIGTETVFSDYNTGDYIAIPSTNVIFFEIVSISGDTSMVVSGLTIPAVSAGASFYPAQKAGLTYKQNNISIQYTEHPTFLFSGETIISNYIGDVAIFRNWNENDFLLPNNVFGEDVIGNRIGNNFMNNTFSRDVEHNVIGDDFENNTIDNDSDFIDNQIATNFRNNLIICEGFNDNVIGDGFSDNKIFNGNDFVYNQIAVRCNNNTIYGTFGDNKIGNGFDYNVIDGSFNNNSIGNQFNSNETYQDFDGNSLGNDFNNNTIYSNFYKNEILNNFNDNIIGDSGNLDNFEFYRNRIGNDFYENTIRQDFQNNQIGSQYNNNVVNGDFYKNVIGNGFNNNPNIGYNFYGNHIGNEFNNNELIGDYFQDNQIGEYFESNGISYFFKDNKIGNQFENNTLGNTDYFNWDNTSIENLTGRTYNTFYNSLYGDGGENVGNVILGKELIMHFNSDSGTTIDNGSLIIGDTYEITNYIGDDDFTNVADVQSGNINENGCVFIAVGEIPTSWSGGTELTELTIYDEYHKVKFTQWTQNQNGGGFSYERTKVYPSVESTVYFTKPNYGSEIDVIVDGRLEIRRGNGVAIYNIAQENSWNQNQSPVGTEWNSIYTQSEDINGSYFDNNNIDNEFKGNFIFTYFRVNNVKSYVGGNEFSGSVYNNQIGSTTFDNQFLGGISDNTWNDNFYQNIIGNNFDKNTFGTNFNNNIIADNFKTNQIGDDFSDNTIGNGFQTNQIGSYFNNNTIYDYFGYGYEVHQGNKIGNNFYNNTVGEYFYNNTIPDNFTENTIGEYFQWNVVNTIIETTDFTVNLGNITGFTYTATGTSATDDIYTDLGGVTTSEFGVLATFDVEVSGGTVTGVSGNTSGKLYVTGNTITILGTQIGGAVPDDNIVMTVTGIGPKPSVYETYTGTIFERQGGTKRLSFYDENDILTITNINE